MKKLHTLRNGSVFSMFGENDMTLFFKTEQGYMDSDGDVYYSDRFSDEDEVFVHFEPK